MNGYKVQTGGMVCCYRSIILVLIGTFFLSAASVPLCNPGFEDPGNGKIKGWDEADGAYYVSDGSPAEIPCWESEGPVADSGVETGGTPTEGLYTAYLMGSDPSVYQLTNHIISAGEYISGSG